MAKKFKLGQLTEDDFDQDYAPGRSEKTMSAAHRSRLDEMAEEARVAANKIKKSEQIVIVLEPE